MRIRQRRKEKHMIANRTTVLEGWEEPKDLEEKMKSDLEILPELSQPALIHKKEQLYLMHADGRSDEFVDYFLKDDLRVSSAAMDVMRLTAKICGEQYAKELLMFRSFSLEEVISKITDHLTDHRYEQLPEIQQKLDTIQQLDEVITQITEFLQKTHSLPVNHESGAEEGRNAAELAHQKDIMELERKLHEKDADLKAKDMEIASLKAESEMKLSSVRAEYEAKIRYMKLAFDREMDRQLDKERRTLEKKYRAMEKEQEMNQGGFFRRRNRTPEPDPGSEKPEKQDENVEMFLVKVLTENKYKEDQLDVITAAVGAGLSLDEVRCMCSPGMSASSMGRLKDYFLKRKENGGYGY